MLRGRASWLGCCLAVALIGLLAMQEAGQLIGDVGVSGISYPGSSLVRVPSAWSAGTALLAWAHASCTGIPVRVMLGWLLAASVVFTAGYLGLGLGIGGRWKALGIRSWVVVLAAAGLLTDAAGAVAVAAMPAGRSCAAGQLAHYQPVLTGTAAAIAALATVKLGAFAVIAVRVAWTAAMHDRPPAGEEHRPHPELRRVAKALGMQVFIVIVVAILCGLLLLTGQPILEQGVDAERAWVLSSDHLLGAAWGLWALASMAALAAGLRYLASVRVAPMRIGAEPGAPSGQAGQGSWPAAAGRALGRSWWWLAAAGGFAVVAAALSAAGAVRAYWPAVAVVAGVLAVVPLAGAVLAKVTPLGLADVCAEGVRERAWQAGRALAWSVPAILLISVSRSLVQPMILLPASAVSRAVFGVTAVAAVAWTGLFLRDNQPRVRSASDTSSRSARLLDLLDPQLVGARPAAPGAAPAGGPAVPGRLASLVPSLVIMAACGVPLLVFPAHVSRFLSVIAMVGLGLLLLTAFYAVLQILAQLTDPPPLAVLLGMRRAPVVSIVALITLLSALLASGAPLHDVRGPAAGSVSGTAPRRPAVARPALPGALSAWAARQQPGCAVPAAGRKVWPLVLVAAEGGGIRAAWWTVSVMSVLTSTGCGRDSVFLTSGVSGGAVGLALLDVSPRPRAQLRRMAGPAALAAGMDGMLSRDMLAGAFGLNVRAADGPAGAPFPDRAALMEQAWEREVPQLADPFPAARPAVPWHTVFNGTSVAGRCRVLISDIRLTSATRCDDPASPMPGAYDLLRAEPCDRGMSTITAGLLAARFPYVTPSGVITSCHDGGFRDQVIDGGYSENTGMETLDDALAALTPLIRARNDAALRAGTPLIAPMVIFVHNTVDASSAAAPAPSAKPEALIPPENRGDSAVLGANATLLQRASQAAAGWVPSGVPAGQAAALSAAVAGTLGLQAVTVAPQQEPAIGVPLGWTLSQGTRDSLDSALRAYLSCTSASLACAQSRALDALLLRWGTRMTIAPASLAGQP